jgi:hypothetical protein
MAAILSDLSRRGDQGFPLPNLFSEVQALLASWLVAANAQNPTQLLEVLTGPAADAEHLGWTIRATLAATSGGAPVQLISQWVATLATTTVTSAVGLAAGHNPAGGLGAHGLLSGGQLHAVAGSLNPAEPYPALAWVARSLAPGQEYFGFCLSLHTFSTRQAVVLLIAKDVTSGLWHLHNTTMSGLQCMVAWNLAADKEIFATALWSEFFNGPPFSLRHPAAWMLATPSIVHVTPLPPVRRWDPVVLPADFGAYTRTFATGGYFKGADGSEWLLLGPSRLAVRLIDAP